MNKKVIYIFPRSPLRCLEQAARLEGWCQSVHTENKTFTWLFSGRLRGESFTAVWTGRTMFRGFQVQIEAKAAFTSASAHIKHMEADLSRRLHH